MMKFLLSAAIFTVLGSANAAQGSYFRDQEAQENFFRRSAEFFKRDESLDRQLSELNPDWQLEQIWPESGKNQEITACRISDAGDEILFLACDSLDFVIMSFTRDGKISRVASIPLNEEEFMGNRFSQKLYFNREFIVVTSAYGTFIIKRPENFASVTIKSAANSVIISDDRLFLLMGKELLRYDFAGQNRETIFSDSQENKVLDIQKQNPNLIFHYVTLNSHDANVLNLVSSSGKIAIWSLDLTTRQSKKLHELPPLAPGLSEITRYQNKLYFQVGGTHYKENTSGFFCYDLTTNELKPLIGKISRHDLRTNKTTTTALPGAVRLEDAHFANGKFLQYGDWLLIGGELLHNFGMPTPKYSTPGVANLIDLESYPDCENALRLPCLNGFYPAPDGKGLIAVEFFRLTRISPLAGK